MRYSNISTKKFFLIETTFGQRDGEPAFRAIVRTFYQTATNQTADGVLNFDLVRKIDAWRRPDFQPVTNFQIARAAKVVAEGVDLGRIGMARFLPAGITAPGYSAACGYSADENDHVFLVFEPLRGGVLFVVDQANHRDGRRWIHDAGRAFVV